MAAVAVAAAAVAEAVAVAEAAPVARDAAAVAVCHVNPPEVGAPVFCSATCCVCEAHDATALQLALLFSVIAPRRAPIHARL